MDELKITSKFATSIISKAAERFVLKKFGYRVKIGIQSIDIAHVNNETDFSLVLNGKILDADLTKFTAVISAEEG